MHENVLGEVVVGNETSSIQLNRESRRQRHQSTAGVGRAVVPVDLNRVLCSSQHRCHNAAGHQVGVHDAVVVKCDLQAEQNEAGESLLVEEMAMTTAMARTFRKLPSVVAAPVKAYRPNTVSNVEPCVEMVTLPRDPAVK